MANQLEVPDVPLTRGWAAEFRGILVRAATAGAGWCLLIVDFLDSGTSLPSRAAARSRGTTARLRIPRKSSAQRHARGILYCMVPGSAPKLLAQMRRGAIEFCVLALLRDGETYGLDLARTLAADGLVTGEGTIYPLLSRLRQEGMVETSWHESPQGPPRRYYRLTEDGRAALDAFIVHWRQFRDAVDVVLEGDQSL